MALDYPYLNLSDMLASSAALGVNTTSTTGKHQLQAEYAFTL